MGSSSTFDLEIGREKIKVIGEGPPVSLGGSLPKRVFKKKQDSAK